jgi:hypothetical protein
MQPLAIDLYCGLGGWAEGFLAEGYRVVGFDIERHDYGTGGYPGQLVIQDVTTLHGSQFKDAAVIVASPPCQAYSYRAMPWKKAKALPPPDNTLFETCFRIQREASESAGRYIPMVVENVRGAQKWVGRAKANFGSYYLWGDVGMVGRRVVAGSLRFGVHITPMKATKNDGGSWFAVAHNTESGHSRNPVHGLKLPGNNSPRRWEDREVARLCDATKVPGMNWSGHGSPDYKPKGFNVTAAQRFRAESTQRIEEAGVKQRTGGKHGWFGPYAQGQGSRNFSSKSDSRKAASAMIAKIPFPLANHIAKVFKQGATQ